MRIALAQDYERAYRTKSVVPEPIVIAGILKDYGWTYDEYLDTPEWIIEAIMAKRAVENKLEAESYDKLSKGRS